MSIQTRRTSPRGETARVSKRCPVASPSSLTVTGSAKRPSARRREKRMSPVNGRWPLRVYETYTSPLGPDCDLRPSLAVGVDRLPGGTHRDRRGEGLAQVFRGRHEDARLIDPGKPQHAVRGEGRGRHRRRRGARAVGDGERRCAPLGHGQEQSEHGAGSHGPDPPHRDPVRTCTNSVRPGSGCDWYEWLSVTLSIPMASSSIVAGL